jgi:hypothetical protein
MREKKFAVGDRVRVSDDFFWARGASGVISKPPDEVTAISGSWDGELTRQEISALGTNIVYWVWFDEPQYDADGSVDCDICERRTRYYKSLVLWKSLLNPLTPEGRRSLARSSRDWPSPLRRRLASALASSSLKE